MKTYLARIERLNNLIKMKATGTPTVLAEKLGISERRLFQYIEFMKKELNAPIKYSDVRQTYFYRVHGEIKLNWIKFNNNGQEEKTKKKKNEPKNEPKDEPKDEI